jgi:hypothetical protein
VSLKFSEKAHRYWCDGKPIPGVTTLIKGGLPSPALVYWSAKSVAEYVADNPEHVEQLRTMGRAPMVAALKSVPWEARDQAAIRGTDVHALAEDLVAGREVAVPEHLADYVEGYVAWLDLWQPEVVWTERPVANRRWWYAGKPDAIVRIGGDVWLLDWKTARGIYGDNAIQTAAYANAEFSVTPEGDEEPMPHIDRLGVVHITPNGTELHEVNDPAAAWKDAQHIFWTAKAKDRIEGYLAPVAHPSSIDEENAS